MNRLYYAIIAICVAAVAGFAVSVAYADEPDFKSPAGIKKFWEDKDREGNGGGGSS
jgi:hypothetical protein